jgi:hypothetical protein
MPRELLLMEVVQGEGRTRTSDPRATLHGFKIKTVGMGTITEQIRALDLAQAEHFLRNRYPSATSIEPIKKPPKPIINIKEGSLVPCPKCSSKHKVLAAGSSDQKLNFIFCRSVKRFIAVGLEGRYLPQIN